MKKIILLNIFYFSFCTVAVKSAEKGGMPQLDPEFWVSQIFWLTITFGTLFLVLSKFILPRISKNLEQRRLQILENIETAEKQREQSEKNLKEFDEIILKSKNKAKEVMLAAREKVVSEITKKKMKIDEGKIEFKNVHFKYSENEENVLKGVNLEFKGRKMTALVGHSGSGKSTILNLIPRFYQPDLGDILIDNKSNNLSTL